MDEHRYILLNEIFYMIFFKYWFYSNVNVANEKTGKSFHNINAEFIMD